MDQSTRPRTSWLQGKRGLVFLWSEEVQSNTIKPLARHGPAGLQFSSPPGMQHSLGVPSVREDTPDGQPLTQGVTMPDVVRASQAADNIMVEGQVVSPPSPPTTRGSVDHENIAEAWWLGGVSVVPILANGTKSPTREWSTLQHAAMPRQEMTWTWRPGQNVGVAAICGKVSGGLEMLELEAAASGGDSLTKITEECERRGVTHLWDSLQHQGYAEWTPSGGIHFLYRIDDHEVPGNTKLAQKPDGKTLAETRGEGGYVIVAPTGGACHPSGQDWITVAGTQGVVPTITWSQRQAIHAAITAALDESPPPPPITPRREVAIRTGEEMRPGDLWEQEHDWDEPWFTSQGWRRSHSDRNSGETFWTRPGKDVRDGHSASTGYNGQKDRLYIWSTSTGLPSETPLSKFFVYSHYNHNGSMAAAASALAAQGYKETVLVGRSLRAFEDGTTLPTVQLQTPPSYGGLGLTDTGSGRRMKHFYGDKFRFNTTEEAWYEWTGSVWRRDRHKAIHRAAVDVAERALNATVKWRSEAIDKEDVKLRDKAVATATAGLNLGRLTAAMACFASEDGISVTSEQFDQDTNLLNLANGTLDLDTLELYDPQPENLLTLTMGIGLDKDAECPKFEQFMMDAFPDVSIREYVQRSLGYSLLGKADQRAIFMLHGPSGTGKSVLTSVMSAVFGGYGITAPASTFRLKAHMETLDLNRLRGARFITTSELPEGQQLDEDLVKRFTGSDKVMSRGHYQDFIEWQPTGVIWLATNYLPKINSDDNAIWKRAKSVRMATEFTADGREEIPGYAKILAREEADGIFNWLLRGLEDFRLHGLNQPDGITQDVLNYRTEADTVACFMRDFTQEGVLVRDSESEIKSQNLRALFDQYCKDNHYQALGVRRYTNRLTTLGLEAFKRGGTSMWRGVRQDLEYGVLASVHW